MTRYCVIGAGAAGLSAVERCAQAGLQRHVLREERPGRWALEHRLRRPAPDHVPRHHAFEGFPMPEHYPHFPRRDQIRDYIASFARHARPTRA